jgi:magnesium-transporting ATPase (P-type)
MNNHDEFEHGEFEHGGFDNSEFQGLSEQQAAERLAADGPNDVPQPRFDIVRAVLMRLWEPSAWILEGALIVEIVLGKYVQAGFIVLMLLFAALNGAIQSARSDAVLQALSHTLTPTTTVRRGGTWQQVDAKNLVVGDLVSLERGDIVPADARLLRGTLHADESTISGESASIRKDCGQVAFAGTQVLAGDALAQITATGARSRSGKTISLVNRAGAPGHLQRLLGRIIGYLAALDAVLAIALIIVAVVRGENIIELFPFLAMLFIATIPIAMPSSFSVANAVEARNLSRRQILVGNLTGIQEAANVDILLVDKTGTLTRNQTRVSSLRTLSWHWGDRDIIRFAMAACDQYKPSPLEAAILDYGALRGMQAFAATHATPFDASLGYSSACVQSRPWLAPVDVKLGSYRMLKKLATHDSSPGLNSVANGNEFEGARTAVVSIDGTLAGLFLFEDQLRSDSAAAVDAIRRRGVKVMMLTGDGRPVASAIARAAGIAGEVVTRPASFDGVNLDAVAGICDVTPEDKLALVRRLQAEGHVVGMTGDGANDAPALRQADVGIAVANAVDLAKRSADMVLMTDGLSSVTQILDSGHRVYQRMMTWTITKLSRTAELTVLLTVGYLFLKFIPLSLNAMVLVAILNDLVTMVLGTDDTVITYHPERWNLARLSLRAGVLAAGWTAAGFGVLQAMNAHGFSPGQISTALYCYLIFSAMLTIAMTRTRKPFWRSRPSAPVSALVIANCVLTIVLSVFGWGLAAISPLLILVILAGVLVVGIALTGIEQLAFRRAEW